MATSEGKDAAKQAFACRVAEIEAKEGYVRPAAWGLGLARVSKVGDTLDAWFPVVNVGENYGAAAILADQFFYLSV